MTIGWLIFKLVLHFVAQLNTGLVRLCIFFFDYFLMVGSARTEEWPAFAKTPAFDSMATTQPITSFFQPVKIKQSKKRKPWNVMKNYAKLTWGRSC